MNTACTLEPIRLVQTCYACPEQYDGFHCGEQVAYYRLRHGSFTVETTDAGGDLVYEAEPDGDGLFEDHERDEQLEAACRAVFRVMGVDYIGGGNCFYVD